MKYSNIVFERSLGRLKGEIKIEVDIESTKHSDERKFRHGEEITDAEILLTSRKAVPKITKALIFDHIDISDELRVFDTATNLNVICKLEGEKLSALKLVVITVMRKKDFKPKSGTKTIEV